MQPIGLVGCQMINLLSEYPLYCESLIVFGFVQIDIPCLLVELLIHLYAHGYPIILPFIWLFELVILVV